ncbi:RES family NAD+ phosphorylase [Leucobacter aridicollis]|uniref:RES family NAD+ phosphorylase n=1 Tax=Leucobacter aridicollis TaxID=283878 RepID=UPI00216A11D1|nr:RES family NAD+ phosphorylase [Leucobacter aridicollis]
MGSDLYRVHSGGRPPASFNPGFGAATRFAFFGSPHVPILYAAASEQAAVAETLLHDGPLTGGQLLPREHEGRITSRLRTTRELRLAAFLGLGLRALGVRAEQVTATPASSYGETVKWAEAAHAAGFDGVVHMSRQCNSDQAYAFFGDRCDGAFEVDSSYSWRFDDVSGGREKLITLCGPLGVEVLVPPAG